MLFTSLSFLTFFLPAVLLVSWALAWVARGRASRLWRASNAILLLASLLFYFWGEGWGVTLLLSSIVVNYSMGRLIASRSNGRARLALLVVDIVANLGALAWFKYAGFGVRCANALAGLSLPMPEIALPLGISFYTFQAMSYVIDVYRRDTAPTRSFIDFACYISMFPQLVAGPIVRYSDIEGALVSRGIGMERVASGMERFLVGLARKAILANVAADFADRAWSMVGDGLAIPPAYAWLALVCYTLQIYYDFSGYSDMAIGIGRMLGFDFPENFDHPYTSKSIREFWRRWHITLSTWFRDYLYIPLGGSRCSLARTCANNLAVFALCGLWHGASEMFLLWGLWHGALIVAERLVPWQAGKSRAASAFAHALTMAEVMFGWVVFRSENLGEARLFLRSLLGLDEPAPATRVLAMDANPFLLCVVAVGVAVATGLPSRAGAALSSRLGAKWPEATSLGRWLLVTSVALFALLLLAGGSYNPFIYFRF